MSRRYGNPGRIDLAHMRDGPAVPSSSAALLGFLAVAVILLGGSMLVLAAAWQVGARVELAALHGGR